MKLVAIVLVQDEVDVWPQVIDRAATFFDEIFVYDTGSIDGSLDVSRADPRVTLVNEVPVVFDEFGTRRHALELVAPHLNDGDYVFWLDSDEMIGMSRTEFEAQFLQESPAFIRHRHYNFGLTRDQLAADPAYFRDGATFNPSKYTFYTEYAYMELKALRWHSGLLDTMVGGRSPRRIANVSPYRIPVLHYQHRSLRQMMRRASARNLAMAQKPDVVWNGHWRRTDINEMFIDPENPTSKTFTDATLARDLSRRDGRYDARWGLKARAIEAVKYRLKSSGLLGPGKAMASKPVEVQPKDAAYNRALAEVYAAADRQMEADFPVQ